MLRYHTLDAARRHAKNNWFEGAMYPWQVDRKGVEQTPVNCGAFYAIHITGDIAFTICRYWELTQDDEFMLSYGAEILYETARFWSAAAITIPLTASIISYRYAARTNTTSM